MIYLDNITDRQLAYFPRISDAEVPEVLELHMTHNVTKRASIVECRDQRDAVGYYHVAVTLPDGMDDGEHTYALRDGEGKAVSSGLLVIGADIKEISKVIQYEQD